MKTILQKLIQGFDLSEEETFDLFEQFMEGASEPASDAQIGAYLFKTASRDIPTDEIVGAARCLRKHMVKVELGDLGGKAPVDTCGTGGSGKNTFNTSTACAFVVAASGQPVVKHGNRSSLSASGSADVLQALGIRLELAPEQISECIQKTRFGFCFAPHHHPATKRVMGIRRELGFRTIFNFLGPLCNPGGVRHQVLGVSDRGMVVTMAKALSRLGTERALVVCAADRLDELTTTGETFVAEVNGNLTETYSVNPEDFGLPLRKTTEIEGFTPDKSGECMKQIFQGDKSETIKPYREIVALNVGATFYVTGQSQSIREGIELAEQILDAGDALRVLESVVQFTSIKH